MKHTATHWSASSYNEFGDPSFGSPTLLISASGNAVRWENKVERFITKNGDEDQGRAIVYSAVTEFQVGDYLFLGNSTATNPETVTNADRVKYAEKISDVPNKRNLFKAIL